MAPKKGGKKDAKKGADGPSAELTDKDLLEQARLRIESLEMQLVWREDKVKTSLASQAELQQRVSDYHSDFATAKAEMFDISSDMSRQYKERQEYLMAQINALNQTIQEQKDELERAQLALEDVQRSKAQELARKDTEIAEQKAKMESMAVEFGEMLQETLDKMSAKIEITNASWEAGTGDSIARRLESHKLAGA
jgi:predicted  nucleic acid-binding Zn-ribbon protein